MKILVSLVLPLAGFARRAYWFLVRPKTVGAKIVLTSGERLLLVRHTYELGIYGLPGGAVDRGEDPATAIEREIREELGIEMRAPRCLGIVQSDAEYKRDTVHVFTAPLDQATGLRPDAVEIAEVRWAELDELPALGPVTEQILQFYRARRSL